MDSVLSKIKLGCINSVNLTRSRVKLWSEKSNQCIFFIFLHFASLITTLIATGCFHLFLTSILKLSTMNKVEKWITVTPTQFSPFYYNNCVFVFVRCIWGNGGRWGTIGLPPWCTIHSTHNLWQNFKTSHLGNFLSFIKFYFQGCSIS